MVPLPPTTRTVPFSSSVAVCIIRAVDIECAGESDCANICVFRGEGDQADSESCVASFFRTPIAKPARIQRSLQRELGLEAVKSGASPQLCSPFPFQNLNFMGRAVSSSVCSLLNPASQASDVGSIPIARSITSDDSNGLTWLSRPNPAQKWSVLDRSWTELRSIGPKFLTRKNFA